MAPGVVFMYVHLLADKTNRKHFFNVFNDEKGYFHLGIITIYFR